MNRLPDTLIPTIALFCATSADDKQLFQLTPRLEVSLPDTRWGRRAQATVMRFWLVLLYPHEAAKLGLMKRRVDKALCDFLAHAAD